MSWQGEAVPLNEEISYTLGELIDGWRVHVHRLVAEIDFSADRGTWGAHDYIAALHIRDAAERGITALPDEIRTEPMNQLLAIDSNFAEHTEPDDIGQLGTFMSPESINDGWWWRRLPPAGPVRREIG